MDDGGTVSLIVWKRSAPKVGDDLRSSALEAIYYALLLITVYISGRFEQRWGTAALLAGALTATMIALQWMGVPTEGRILAALLLTLFLCWRFASLSLRGSDGQPDIRRHDDHQPAGHPRARNRSEHRSGTLTSSAIR